MGPGVAGEKALQAHDVEAAGRTDQDGAAGAGFDQGDPAQDQRAYDPLAELGFGDQQGPQSIGGNEQRLHVRDRVSVDEGGTAGELAHLGEEVTRPFLENREHASQALAPRDGDGPRDDDEHPRTDLARPVQRFASPVAPHGAEAAEPLDLLRAEPREPPLAPGLERRHGEMVQAFRSGSACGATPGRACYSAARDGRGDRRSRPVRLRGRLRLGLRRADRVADSRRARPSCRGSARRHGSIEPRARPGPGCARVARQRHHLVLDRPHPRRPRPRLAVSHRARARLVRAPHPKRLQRSRRALAAGRQVRTGLQHRGAAARRHHPNAAAPLRRVHRARRPDLGGRIRRCRLAVQPSTRGGGRLRRSPRQRGGRPRGGRSRRLHRLEIRRPPAISKGDQDRADHARGAQDPAGRRRRCDDRRPARPDRFRRRAVDHPRRAPPHDRGAGGPSSGDSARPRHRALLHVTQRGLQRPCGAHAQRARYRARASVGRGPPRLARAWIRDEQPRARDDRDVGACVRIGYGRLGVPESRRPSMKRNASVLSIVMALVVATVVVADQAEKIGQVRFPVSCSPAVQQPFERAVALLHSFWYLEAAKAFTQITQTDPGCAMAYWGLALTNWTQIWSPPPAAALKRGADAIEKAKTIGGKTPREREFIAAVDAFFKDADKSDHRTRAAAYGRQMEQMAQRYPNDREVMAFYALSLQATADPRDKTYANQKRSAQIAEKIFAAEPDHPGAAHYMIHGYDYPALAQ